MGTAEDLAVRHPGGYFPTGAVYYWMFPQFYIEYFTNGPYAETQFDLADHWVEQYGPTLEPEERERLDSQLAEEISAFDAQITAIPDAAAAGLTNYVAFLSFREDYLNGVRDSNGQADMDTEYLLNRVYGGTNWYRIEVLIDTMETYDTQEDRRAQIVSNRQQDGQLETMVWREAELASSETAHSLLLSSVKHSTQEYGKDLAVWCVLSVVLLLSPTLVRDRLQGTRAMQWLSRRGRGILNVQMGAALLSALALTIVNLNIYAIPFLAQGPLQFAACGLDGMGRPLVQLDLRHLSAGAGGAVPGPFPGSRRSNSVPLPIQRQLHRHASEGGPPVRGGWRGAGLLAAGHALHVPQSGQRRRLC